MLVGRLLDKCQACNISGFRPEITGSFIAFPALRLSHENLRQKVARYIVVVVVV